MAYRGNDEYEHGAYYKPEVKTSIKLTLAFAKAVGRNQEDQSDNLVVSPYNATAALSMVAKGAVGETRDELAKALFATDGAGLDDAVAAYAKLNTEILKSNAGQVTLTTANGVWTNKDLVTLRDAFAKDLKETMGAEISAEDYANPATVQKINDWAAKNTNGLITKVLEELNPDDAAVLASALHFKGEWTKKFDKALTEDKTFTQDGAAAATTPTMHQDFADEGGFRYQKGKDFEAITMTYGEEKHGREEWKNPTMRIVLVRPTDDNVSARDFLSSQDAGKIPAWLDAYAFEDAIGSVELPRMDIKQKFDLIPALRELGVDKAFGGGSFENMVEQGGEKLFVSKVSHDTVFKTDEVGSEAAAVTTAVMTLESVRMPPVEVDVKLDRSFVFALQDVKTNAVLFIGAVNKPNDDVKPAKAPKAKAPGLK
ncbi:MAG TPA: serpin family protein [Patescibacteria group bacterium]|nr:serpin family protein [Patescibacteria group bacterium]